jgi:hypothetical protein
MAQAVMEGVTFAFRDCQRVLKDAGTDFSRLLAVGGGSKSELWLKLIATNLDIEIALPEDGDFGGSLGVARLGPDLSNVGRRVESLYAKGTDPEMWLYSFLYNPRAEAERRRQEEEIARLRAELEAKKAAEQPAVQPQPQPAVQPKAAAEQPDMDFSNIPPVFTRPQPQVSAPPIPEAPQPIVPLSRTEEMLREIIGVNETVGTPHFRGGYRKGVAIMKMLIVQLLDEPTVKNRAELKERINLL